LSPPFLHLGFLEVFGVTPVAYLTALRLNGVRADLQRSGTLSEQNSGNGISGLTTSALEVLACIAFRQPIGQAEIDRLFDADKRGLVVKLRALKLVEEFAGTDGRLHFATTEAFLQRFGLASLAN
jgi:chromosome segregation and condensation protein ScpB